MPATRYLCKLIELDMVFATIDAAIKAPPTIDYHIQCYHMETRYYTVTGENGRTIRKKKKVRVDTHSADESFNIKKWEDQSPPSKTLHYLSVLLLTRL